MNNLRLRIRQLQPHIPMVFTFFLLFALAIIFTLSAAQLDKPVAVDCVNVVINAKLNPDGSMRVIEERTFYFHKQSLGAEIKYRKDGKINYRDVSVRENRVDYLAVNQLPTTEPGTYAVDDYEDYTVVDWSYHAFKEQRTFIIEYTVEDVVVAHNDVAELYYKFIGNEWDMPTARASVTVSLPAGARVEELKAWGHGPLQGLVTIDNPQQVTWEIASLPKKTFLEARLVFPPSLVPEVSRFSNKESLPAIISEETRWARWANLVRLLNFYEIYISVALLILTGVILAFMHHQALNRRNVYRGTYYRELPGDYPPEVAAYLMDKKKIDLRLITARILDLARREHLSIKEISDATGNRKAKKRFLFSELKSSKPKDELDNLLLDFLFTKIHTEINKDSAAVDSSNKTIHFEDIQTFAKKKPWTSVGFFSAWRKLIEKAARKEGFFIEKTGKNYILAISLFMAMIGLAALLFLNLLYLYLSFALAAFAVFFFSPQLFYTPRGADHLLKWKAFKRFMMHFSRLEHASPPSLAVWEHYLVYAVAFSIAGKVISLLALVYPNIKMEPGFTLTSWSSISDANIDHLVDNLSSLTQTLNSTLKNNEYIIADSIKNSLSFGSGSSSSGSSSGSSSSGSGSGGGFSGGGGGGFGGGGGSFR